MRPRPTHPREKDPGHPPLVRTAEGEDRHPGPRRDHRRRPAARPADARLRQRRLRQDHARRRVHRPRRHRDGRARGLHDLRGERRGAQRERALARLRPRQAGAAEEGRARLRPHRAQRDRGDRRVRPRGPLHPPRPCDRHDRRQAGRARHGRGPVRRLAESRHPPRRTAAPVPLAEGPRRHRGHHRRARREHAHPLRPRGVRGRLRDPARPPHRRSDLDPAAARRQVPRHAARHQRVSVPDRRRRHLGAADHLDAARSQGPERARLDRHRRARRDVRRQGRVPRQQRPGLGLARAPARARSRSRSSTPPAGARSGRCCSATRNRRAR